MNCQKCGAPLEEDDRFCKNCGSAVEAKSEQMTQVSQTEQLAQPEQIEQSKPEAETLVQPVAPISTASTISSNNMAAPIVQTSKPNSNVLKYVVFGALAVLAVIIAVVITVLVMNGSDKPKSDGTGSAGVGVGTEVGAGTSKQSTYTLRFNGFSMQVPDDWITEDHDTYMMLGDASGEWVALLEINEGAFSKLKANRSQLKLLCEEGGFTCNNIQLKTIGGEEFVTLEMVASGQTSLMAFAEVNARYYLALQIATIDNEADYDLLETMVPFVQSITYGTGSNKVDVDNKLNLNVGTLAQ